MSKKQEQEKPTQEGTSKDVKTSEEDNDNKIPTRPPIEKPR